MYIPLAICLSYFDFHESVPGSSITTGLPLLEPGLESGLDKSPEVVKLTMRTEGRLNRTSICASGTVAGRVPAGRLNARRAIGVEGPEVAMVIVAHDSFLLYHRVTMILWCIGRGIVHVVKVLCLQGYETRLGFS